MSQLNIVPQHVLADNGIKFQVKGEFMEFTKDAETIRSPLDNQTDALRLQAAVKQMVDPKYKHAVIVPYLEHMQMQTFDDAWNVKQWFDKPYSKNSKPEECLAPGIVTRVWHGTEIPLEKAMAEDGMSFNKIDITGQCYHHYVGKGMFMALFAKANPNFTITTCKEDSCPSDKGIHQHAVYGFYRSKIPLEKNQPFMGDMDEEGAQVYTKKTVHVDAAPPLWLPYKKLEVREAGTMRNRVEAAKSSASRLITVLDKAGVDTCGGNFSAKQSECGDSVNDDNSTVALDTDEAQTKFKTAKEAYQVIMNSDYNRWVAIARDTKNLPWMRQEKFSASIKNQVNAEVQRLNDRIRDSTITSAELATLIFKKYGGNSDKRYLAYFFKRFAAGDCGISQVNVNGQEYLEIS